MRRLLPSLITLLVTSAAVAAPVVMGNVCAPVERELASQSQQVRSLESQLTQASSKAERLQGQLEELDRRLADATQSRAELQGARQDLCSGTGTFVGALLAGKLAAGAVGSCVTPDQQAALARKLGTWATVERLLGALVIYDEGAVDSPPVAPSDAKQPIEKLVQRLLGNGRSGPTAARRLVIEAMQRIAPRSLRKLRQGGASALDAWFTSSSRLDEALAEEVRNGVSGEEPAAQGEELASAHELVRAYTMVAGCAQRPTAARGCVRAQTLLDLLDTSGPLVTLRRIQSIWSADCTALGPPTTVRWLQDLAGARGEKPDEAWHDVREASLGKLSSCWLRAAETGTGFSSYSAKMLPGPEVLDARSLARLEVLRARIASASAFSRCGAAVHAIEGLASPSACHLDDEALGPVRTFVQDAARDEGDTGVPLRACRALLRDRWEGRAAEVTSSFSRPPGSAADWVTIDQRAPQTPLHRLRELCNERAGSTSTFPVSLGKLAKIAATIGEQPGADPWRVETPSFHPIELARAVSARRTGGWLAHVLGRTDVCTTVGVKAERCNACALAQEGASYDCTLLHDIETSWARADRTCVAVALLLLVVFFALRWAVRLSRALRDYGPWIPEAQGHFRGLGLDAQPEPLRYLFPSRMKLMTVDLPSEGAWVRWGARACAVRVQGRVVLTEHDVNDAASAAQSTAAEVVIIVHDEQTSPDLGAVRAMLEWAARGAGRAVQCLPVSMERLKWAGSSDDLLDLIEESSLRGNPFEVRGRITSSSQFFNRERLVSGLLAGAQAGHWTVITGLRRFGKSSLALEVARRLPGPSAYVDLAGFYHELSRGEDATGTADAILRYTCLKLHESARARDRVVELPAPPVEGARLDVTELTRWFGSLTRAIGRDYRGRTLSALLILDEIEQALGLGQEHLRPALDALSIVLGRLRGSLADPVAAQGGIRVGILLCSAVHPLLWAPLSALAGQSIMGAFSSVSVPRLPDDAAHAMMRGLGARQGIRFTEAALDRVVRETQGVPLLLRRLGSSVLELYDPERARAGGLGAVEIGAEGAAAALAREEEEGAPLRVWIETEIAELGSPSGLLLRHLAEQGRATTAALRKLAAERVRGVFVATGMDRTLPVDELDRRVLEAGSVIVRLLGDTGILEPEGDLTNPEAYTMPDAIIRRVLSR